MCDYVSGSQWIPPLVGNIWSVHQSALCSGLDFVLATCAL